MSDYLLNLARRSAGFTPVIGARPLLPIVRADDGDGPADVVSPHAAAGRTSSSEVAAAPLAAQPTAVVPRAERSPAVPAPRSTAGVRTAQRAPAAGTAPATVAAPRAASPPRTDAPAVPPRAATGAVVRASATIVPAAMVVLHASSGASEDAPLARDEPREAPAPAPRVEQVDAPAAGDEPVPGVATIEPASRAVAAAATIHAAPTPERSIHVRIGVIEILGAEDRPTAPAAATPAPSPAVVAGPGGFDEYAALRRYTPWTW